MITLLRRKLQLSSDKWLFRGNDKFELQVYRNTNDLYANPASKNHIWLEFCLVEAQNKKFFLQNYLDKFFNLTRELPN